MPSSPRPAAGPLTRAIVAVIAQRYADVGFRQETLGDLLGVSQQQVSRILRGERAADIDQLWTLCTAVGLDFIATVEHAVTVVGERPTR